MPQGLFLYDSRVSLALGIQKMENPKKGAGLRKEGVTLVWDIHSTIICGK